MWEWSCDGQDVGSETKMIRDMKRDAQCLSEKVREVGYNGFETK